MTTKINRSTFCNAVCHRSACLQGRAKAEPQLPDLLTMEDLAALFGVSQLMADPMLHSGSLPTTMAGRRTVVSRKAFLQWLSGKFKSTVGST